MVGPYYVSTPPSLFPSFYRGFPFPPPFAFSLLPSPLFRQSAYFKFYDPSLSFSHIPFSLSLPHSMCSSTISLLPYSFVLPYFFFWLGKERMGRYVRNKSRQYFMRGGSPPLSALVVADRWPVWKWEGEGGKSIRMNFSSTQNTFPYVSREEKYIYFQFRTPR